MVSLMSMELLKEKIKIDSLQIRWVFYLQLMIKEIIYLIIYRMYLKN